MRTTRRCPYCGAEFSVERPGSRKVYCTRNCVAAAARARRTTPCSIEGCQGKAAGRGWCSGHYQRWQKHGSPGGARLGGGRTPINEAVLERIDLHDDGCWVWVGTILETGYGQLWTTEGVETGRSRSAHRLAYEEFHGPIPEGMELDHLCHDPATCWGGNDCPHRRCVNPAHLSPVTPLVNSLRTNHTARTHCKHGHEFTPENTFRNHGRRGCRACQSARAKAYRRAAKEAGTEQAS